MSTPAEALEANAVLRLDRQRHDSGTMKLAGTFVSGIAATMTATTLQVEEPSNGDLLAAVFFGASICALLALISLDRIREPNHEAIIEEAAISGWSPKKTARRVARGTLAAARFNETQLRWMSRVLVVQVLLAISSGAVAVFELMSAP